VADPGLGREPLVVRPAAVQPHPIPGRVLVIGAYSPNRPAHRYRRLLRTRPGVRRPPPRAVSRRGIPLGFLAAGPQSGCGARPGIEHRAVRRALGAAARARGGERRRDVFHLRGPQGHRLRRAATAYAPGAGRCRTARGPRRVALPDGPAPLALAPGAQSAAIRSAPSVSMIAPMMMRYHNTVMIHRFFTHP